MSIETRLRAFAQRVSLEQSNRPRTLFCSGTPVQTNSTSWATLMQWTCPPLRPNSLIDITLAVSTSNTNSTSLKWIRVGCGNQYAMLFSVTSTNILISRRVQNRGTTASQFVPMNNVTTSFATNVQPDLNLAINTSVATTWKIEGYNAVLADWAALRSVLVTLYL